MSSRSKMTAKNWAKQKAWQLQLTKMTLSSTRKGPFHSESAHCFTASTPRKPNLSIMFLHMLHRIQIISPTTSQSKQFANNNFFRHMKESDPHPSDEETAHSFKYCASIEHGSLISLTLQLPSGGPFHLALSSDLSTFLSIKLKANLHCLFTNFHL